eukprot:17390-Amphidinium_carterae.1
MQFSQETKNVVRARYGHKCAFCGKQEDSRQPNASVLTVAHFVDHLPTGGPMQGLQLDSARNGLLRCYP